MHPRTFIRALDEGKVVAAITRAEQATSGEIRVFVSHRNCKDALAAAQRHFLRLGMARAPQRNAVLVYFAPRAHAFAIWSDAGIHDKSGPDSWRAIADKISPRLKAGEFTEAIEAAVHEVGVVLARHFPRANKSQG